jgi:hypothetical protein
VKSILAILARLSVVPFESAIAVLVMYSGAVGLLRFGANSDPLTLQLPALLLTWTLGLYLVAGFALFLGVGLPHRGLEAFGLVVVGASLLIRTAALVTLVGLTAPVFNAIVTNAVFLLACLVRNRGLQRGDVILRIEKT